MARKIEEYLPPVKEDGIITDKAISTSTTLAVGTTSTFTGVATFTAAPVFTAAPTGAYLTVTYVGQTTEVAVDRALFVAPVACALVAVSESHGVAAGGASALQITKDTGTTAPGAGSDILTNNTNTGFDMAATANTPQVGTFAATTFAVGDRISFDFANTIQSTAGVVISIILKTT